MIPTLVIGYGDIDRQDKGVGFYVIRELRRRLGQSEEFPERGETCKQSGALPHSIFLRELTPALTDAAAEYGQLLFVRCHNLQTQPALILEPVVKDCLPDHYRGHLTPEKFVDMILTKTRSAPVAYKLRIRGHGYDLVRGLTTETERLIPRAVDGVLSLVHGDGKMKSESGDGLLKKPGRPVKGRRMHKLRILSFPGLPAEP